MLRLVSVAAVAAMLATPAVAAPIHADPDAPPGAPPSWLPREAWVRQHWLPYNEATMLRLLHTHTLQLQLSLHGRTLWEFAEDRGIDPERVLHRLVRPWRKQGADRERLMLERARRTFTQPHLADHMLAHYFHIGALNARWVHIFGVDVEETYREMSAGGLCYLQVGARHRGSEQVVRRDMLRLIRGVEREGVRRHETLPSEAHRFVAQDRKLLNGWLNWKFAR